MQTKNTEHRSPNQPRTITCAACRVRLPIRGFAGGVKNKLMEVGEYARLCEDCCARARVSGKSRRRIEATVLRRCREGVPGAVERVVIFAPEVFAGARS